MTGYDEKEFRHMLDRGIIRSARSFLPHYMLAYSDDNFPEVSYELVSPTGVAAAHLLIPNDPSGHALLTMMSTDEGTTQEGLIINKHGYASRFIRVQTDKTDEVLDLPPGSLNMIWDMRPNTLKNYIPGRELPDDRMIGKILCFVSDAYQKIVELDALFSPPVRESLLQISQTTPVKAEPRP